MQSSGLSSDDQTSVIMRHKEPKNKEPSTPDLLNNSANVKTTIEKNRPRSCMNPTAGLGYDICPNNSRIELENRRWSGVHLGSKLIQAFDRLVFDDSDDYTDSLENKPTAKTTGNDAKVTSRVLCGNCTECALLRRCQTTFCFGFCCSFTGCCFVLLPGKSFACNIFYCVYALCLCLCSSYPWAFMILLKKNIIWNM